jgi:hypothetical protein
MVALIVPDIAVVVRDPNGVGAEKPPAASLNCTVKIFPLEGAKLVVYATAMVCP